MSINKVLVVDDVATDRMALQNILAERGLQVVTASSGAESLEIAADKKPDLIFLDIMMEKMDGFQTCRRLTQGEDTKEIPVVMVSSKNQKADKMWAEKQGAKGYITKPFTSDLIWQELENYGF